LTAKAPKPPNEEVVDRQGAKDAKGAQGFGSVRPTIHAIQIRNPPISVRLAVLAFWRFKTFDLGVLCVLAVKHSDVAAGRCIRGITGDRVRGIA